MRELPAIRLVRVVGVLLILTCHTAQEYGAGPVAAAANVGVQIFLATSGYLFALGPVARWRDWYARRLSRLLPAYYLVLLLTAVAYAVILGTNIVGREFAAHFTLLQYLWFRPSAWGGHLWYMTALALSYAAFPILCAAGRLSRRHFVGLTMVVAPLALTGLFQLFGVPLRLSADVSAFVFGFTAGRLFGTEIPRWSVLAAAGAALVLIALAGAGRLAGAETFLLEAWVRCWVGVGVLLFLCRAGGSRFGTNPLVGWLDRYSYEIYLTHRTFILGPLSLLHLTPVLPLNVGVALSATLIASVLVEKLASSVRSLGFLTAQAKPNSS